MYVCMYVCMYTYIDLFKHRDLKEQTQRLIMLDDQLEQLISLSAYMYIDVCSFEYVCVCIYIHITILYIYTYVYTHSGTNRNKIR